MRCARPTACRCPAGEPARSSGSGCSAYNSSFASIIGLSHRKSPARHRREVRIDLEREMSFVFRRIAYLLVGAAVPLACGACANQPPKESQLDGAAIIESYRQGIAEAIQELRSNSPTIYTT